MTFSINRMASLASWTTGVVRSDEELAYARRVIALLEEAERNDQAAVTVNGKMVDYANIRMIRRA